MTESFTDKNYASVAVDQPLDSTFSYGVPEAMRREMRAGSRVTVPLGRGNRLTAGTVLALSSEPPQFEKAEAPPALKGAAEEDPSLFEGDAGDSDIADGAAAKGIKDIVELHREVLPVPEDLLELAKWISVYYCAPRGMTLATMVPAAVKRGTRMPSNVIVSLPDAGKSTEQLAEGMKISPATKKALVLLHGALSAGAKRELELLTETGAGRAMLKRLVAMGLLKSEREIKLPEPVLVGAGGMGSGTIEHLSADQEAAMAALSPRVESGGFAVRLIHGVTGSGKTELYIRAIEKVVARGKSAIVLVPEISLTPQTVRRFTARFPRVAILHSGMKDSERHQHWHAIASGWAQVIVGARSAIFAPAPNLGLIVVDEEHDASYKQDNLPKYHGRDVALRRGQMLNIPVLLGSATPSLESWHNAHAHKDWELLSLKSRPLGTQMPRVVVVDMKGQAKERRGLHILSTVLEHHLKQTLEQKKQAIFLLNRRGYAHYVMCPRCDWVLMCDNCDATMVVHRKRQDEIQNAKPKTENTGPNAATAQPRRAIRGTVQCHYCLTSMILPERCPLCQARLTHLGQGTQRAEDELLRKFPGLRVQRMDSDSMHHAADYQGALDAFGRGEIDLLIGTQMIAKGLDFPNVQLVGVLNSDLAMTIPDFRAAERTFQLICQVAGRSGRSMGAGGAAGDRGTVVVQTFQPQEPAIAYACNHDYLGFVKSELPHRQEFGYPPYGRLVRIVLSHKGWTQVNDAAASLGRLIAALAEKLKLPIRVQGPFPPPMERLVEMYRVEFIVSAMSARPLQQLVASLRGRGILASAGRGVAGGQVQVTVDVDPVHMM